MNNQKKPFGMNKLNKTVNSVLSALAGGKKGSRRQNAKRNRARRFRAGGVPRTIREAGPWGRALPASYASHVKAAWHVKNMTQTTMHVSGCDLVTPLPGTITSIDGTDMFLFTVIPSNPAYWSGTRIGQVAPAYMNYRPLRMVFHYIPQVAVTQPGTVIMGTLWNGASPSEDLQQTLVTSNGGVMINCYVPGCTQIQLAGNLQQNLFTLPGDLNPDTNSFLFVAVARGCTSTSGTSQVVPGYFFVEYEYVFKNPIGQAWDYTRSLPTRVSDATFALPNRSMVLLEQDGNFGPGTIFDVEVRDGVVGAYYHGSTVGLQPSTLVQVFENGQNNSSATYGQLTTTLVGITASTSGGEELEYIPFDQLVAHEPGGSLTVPANNSIVVVNPDYNNSGQGLVFVRNGSTTALTYNSDTTTPWYYKFIPGFSKFISVVNSLRKTVATVGDAYQDGHGSDLFLPLSEYTFKLPDTSIVLP